MVVVLKVNAGESPGRHSWSWDEYENELLFHILTLVKSLTVYSLGDVCVYSSVCSYMCLCECMYISVYVHVYTCLHGYACMCVCIHIWICVCMFGDLSKLSSTAVHNAQIKKGTWKPFPRILQLSTE